MESIVLLGDSLIQRAASQELDAAGQTIGSLSPRLSDAYARRLDVLNRGFSGYNTRQLLTLLKTPLTGPTSWNSWNARLVVLLIGANDARLPDTPGGPQQHVPLGEFRQNLGKIIPKLRGMNCIPVVLVTPPPVDERKCMEADVKKSGPRLQGIVRRKAAVTAEYAQIVREVGAEKDVPVLDLWGTVMKKAGYIVGADDLLAEYLDENGKVVEETTEVWDQHLLPGLSSAPVNETLQSYLHDGLHFSRKGYDLLYEELLGLIASKWPDHIPDKLKMPTPAWDETTRWEALDTERW